MTPLLIKFGKAIKILEREGFYLGGKRVSKELLALFRRVPSGDILIITGGVADSARYRVTHQAEELEINGFSVSTTVQENPFLSGYHRKFNIFIFHRALYTPGIKNLINSIKKSGGTIIFDTDDLVFDKKYLRYINYYQNMNSLEKKLYKNGVGYEILKDPYVKVCTATTSFLANILRQEGKTVFIVPNKLSRTDLQWAQEIRTHKKQKKHYLIRLGYFSGTISHNRDFATITDALMTLLSRYPNVELLLAGPLDIEKALLSKFGDRVTRSPYVDRKKYFELLSSVDINLAPLESGNPFCDAKSELKFFEPGILDVPTVAIKNNTFQEVIIDGINGFLASSSEEWIEKTEKLILSEALRTEMGIAARKTSIAKYTTVNNFNQEYYQYLHNQCSPRF